MTELRLPVQPAAPDAPHGWGHDIGLDTLVELDRRGSGGIYVYLPLWLGTAFMGGLFEHAPVTAWTVAVLLLVLGSSRWALHHRLAVALPDDPRRHRRLNAALVLANIGTFGAVGAAATTVPVLEPVRATLMLVTGVMCATATMIQAIDPVLRWGVPLVATMPAVVVLASGLRVPDLLMALLIVVFDLYVLKSSENVYRDYWTARSRGAELVERAEQLQRLSETDALTQVANRLHVDRILREVWTTSHRDDDRLSLLLVDVDHFKRINDAHGHLVGDRCLEHVAGALRAGINRKEDLVARWGGEEFLVLLPGVDRTDADIIAERLRGAVAAIEVSAEGTQLQVTCSIGIVTVTGGWMADNDPASAVALADQALYVAKASGRNRAMVAAVGRPVANS